MEQQTTAETRTERRAREKRRRKQMMRRIQTVMSIFFVVVLILTAVLNYFKEDVSFSEQENRVLAQKPEFSYSRLWDGSFMTDMESYIADQFIARDTWIRVKLIWDRLMGRREANDIYIGKGGRLMDKATPADEAREKRNLDAVRAFTEDHPDINMFMALVPSAITVMEEDRPANAPVGDQEQQIHGVRVNLGSYLNFIDVMPALSAHSTENIYYKTDHHWTSLGAYYGFDRIASAMGITPVNNYDIYTVTDDFSGTLASRSGYTNIRDEIQIYLPSGIENDYQVWYPDEDRRTASLFEADKLEEKDKYTVFTGGNHPIIEISTAYEERRVLLIFKDSYANTLLPFLTPYFRKIIVVDPRYYYEDIESVITAGGVTDILYLFNINTFVSDASLADVLGQ